MISLLCLEKERRGGPIYLERISYLIRKDCNTFIHSSKNSYFFRFLLKTFINKQRLVISNGIYGILILITLFINKKKALIVHTPIEKMSNNSRFLIYLFLKLNNKSKLIFVANHLKWKYENHFHKLNLSKRSFTLFGPPKYSYLEKFSYKFEISDLNKINLLFVGGQSPEKGIKFAINLMKILNKEGNKLYKLHIFGKVSDNFISDENVIIYGFSENPFLGFNPQNSLHLMPSKFEGMPLSFVDALTNNIPTVMSNIAAAKELKNIGIKSLINLEMDLKKWSKVIKDHNWEEDKDIIESDFKIYNNEVKNQLKKILDLI